jgi:hypothetical protein
MFDVRHLTHEYIRLRIYEGFKIRTTTILGHCMTYGLYHVCVAVGEAEREAGRDVGGYIIINVNLNQYSLSRK